MNISKIQSLVFIGMGLFALSLLASCKNEMTSYKKFNKNGEITYTGKVDSMRAYSGKHRVLLEGLLVSDPKISEVHVSWDGGVDSLIVPVNRTAGVDTLRIYIDSLESKVHNFKIVTYNKEGDSSIPVFVSGQSYGQRYQSSLFNRPVTAKNYLTGTGTTTITFGSIDKTSGALATQIAYTKVGDVQDTARVSVDSSEISLQNYKRGTDFKFRTLYRPDTTSIDTFATDFKSLTPDIRISALKPSGSGTVSDPYLIADLSNLIWIPQNPSSYSSVFKQTADIDATKTKNRNNGQGFTPIGLTDNFAGTYDGQGYTISNLYINRPDQNSVGFIVAIVDGTLTDFHLVDLELYGSAFVGGFTAYNGGTIENSSISGNSVITSTGGRRTSALVGVNVGTISNTYVEATFDAGGANQTGLLVGYNKGSVINSYAIGDLVNGNNRAAGLIGNMDGGGSIENSYFVGTVESASGDNVGPISGDATNGSYTNNYYDKTVFGSTIDEPGVTGKTTSEMMMESTFSGFDFSGTWSIDEGSSYPYLQNNEQTPHPGTN